jgi:carbon monoxide dehydrogenase subunit G
MSSDTLQGGSQLSVTAHVFGRVVKGTAEVTVWDPPHVIRVETQGGTLSIAFQFTFVPEGDGTRVTAVTEVKAGGIMKMMAPMVGQTVQRQGQEGLEDAKARLESEERHDGADEIVE